MIEINLIDIRTFADNKWNRVDDRPYGGGPGMVLMAKPVIEAVESVKTPKSWVVHMSPQGTPFNAKKARELAEREHVILLCGHYEGIDERALELVVDEEISVGDFVLSNGCVAAIIVVDATSRLVPGVLGHSQSSVEDSFEGGGFDCPHYTRPEVLPEEYQGLEVPKVLLSGDHKKIADWRRKMGEDKTKRIRPDLNSTNE